MAKILIFGMARSGTEILQRQIAYHFNIPNFHEIFIKDELENKLKKLQNFEQSEHGVAKIISGQLANTSLPFPNLSTTHLVVTKRQRLADSCISLHFIKYTKQLQLAKFKHKPDLNHFKHKPDISNFDPIVVPIEEHVHFWIKDMYKPYVDTLRMWNSQGIKYDLIDYESMVSNKVVTVMDKNIDLTNKQNIHIVASEFDYTKLCSNYDEVQDEIIKGIQCL
jgi:hypothetical protein